MVWESLSGRLFSSIPLLHDKVGPELNPLVEPTDQPTNPKLTAASRGKQQSRRCNATNHHHYRSSFVEPGHTDWGTSAAVTHTCAVQCELRQLEAARRELLLLSSNLPAPFHVAAARGDQTGRTLKIVHGVSLPHCLCAPQSARYL